MDAACSAAAVATLVLIVSVEVIAAVPFGVILAGLKEQVEKVGKPLHARLVAELKPLMGVTVTVAVSVVPAAAVAVAGVSDIEKSAAGAAVIVTVTAVDVDPALAASPPGATLPNSLPWGPPAFRYAPR